MEEQLELRGVVVSEALEECGIGEGIAYKIGVEFFPHVGIGEVTAGVQESLAVVLDGASFEMSLGLF